MLRMVTVHGAEEGKVRIVNGCASIIARSGLLPTNAAFLAAFARAAAALGCSE
jgi:hypothetical protein